MNHFINIPAFLDTYIFESDCVYFLTSKAMIPPRPGDTITFQKYIRGNGVEFVLTIDYLFLYDVELVPGNRVYIKNPNSNKDRIFTHVDIDRFARNCGYLDGDQFWQECRQINKDVGKAEFAPMTLKLVSSINLFI